MTKGDVICPECGARFRRIELAAQRGKKGEYRCPACDTLLERLTDEKLVAYRLTIQPSLKALLD